MTEQDAPLDLIMVEDSTTDVELVTDALRDAGLTADVRRVDDEPAFLAALDERLPDTILADWSLPQFSGRRALEIARERCPEVPLIFVSGTMLESTAIEALRQGATDYVYKHQLQQLGPALIRALGEAQVLRSLRQSEEKYRLLFESSRDALTVLMPPSWHFTDPNTATLELFGAASKDNFAALAPWDVSPERQSDGRPSAEKALEMIATAVREGSHFFEWEHRRLNGETFLADILLTRMEVGEQIFLQATMRDITERKRTEDALRQGEAELNESQRLGQIGSWEWNALTDTIRLSEEYYRIYGFDPKQPAPNYVEHQKLYTHESAERLDVVVKRAIETGEPYEIDLELAQPTPATRWVAARGEAKRDANGKIWGLRGTSQNITERKLAEAALRQVNRQNEMILTSVGEGIYGVDTAGIIYFINPSAASLLGYMQNELLGKDSHATLHYNKPDGGPYRREDCPIHLSLAGGLVLRGVEETLWHKDGSPLPVLFSSVPIMEGDAVVGAVATFQDIRERKRYEAQLERHANFDDLTGLPNSNLLTDRLTRLVASCRREGKDAAVLLFNLDRFKEITDSLGHGLGDKLLREASARLGAVSGTINTLAHSGRNEFVLLAETREIGEVVSLVQGLLKVLAQPFLIEKRELFLSASIGIAMFPQDGENSEALLKNAGAAMYRAKAAGGNGFNFYAAEMNAHSLERLNLENELRRAVERDELRLHYQPQLNLRNGEIIGMEALVRWQHPVRGLVSPLDFIPLAEETGLIVPIGEWVLRTACIQNKAWQAAGLPAMSVAVNLSARQFEGQDMVALTKQVLHETGLDPSYLELELTEGAAMGNAGAFVGITEALKALSVTLSIDDFGTGYSSLSYLKRFALDRLKIDQSFVDDIVQDPGSAAIAVAVIALGHSLGLSVIAEGVETEAQLNFLRTRGCDEMQGLYFSKPLPAAEFEQLLRERRKLVFSAEAELPEHTLLLLDDEPAILSALKRLLRREGYHILTANSAAEGMELLAIHEVAVVMTDQRMPHMTGAEFLAKVRVMYPDTIRIILSGYTDLKSITDVVNRGEIYKFLEKPWDDAALLETLHEAFQLYEARHKNEAKSDGLPSASPVNK